VDSTSLSAFVFREDPQAYPLPLRPGSVPLRSPKWPVVFRLRLGPAGHIDVSLVPSC